MPRPPSHIHLTWSGARRFDAGRPGGPTLRLDGDGATGQSPVDGVLSALAACASVDVVDILTKQRTPPSRYEVDVTGERFDGTPARLVRIKLVYRIAGEGIERAPALRAIDLAVNKYCSVRDSLDPRIPVEYELELL
ncbi:MAG TPA: OsmC family protein [Gemmatimonadaceae bacterium]|nr:OsmC family protein [Gemmatimonadaceae bacterium]